MAFPAFSGAHRQISTTRPCSGTNSRPGGRCHNDERQGRRPAIRAARRAGIAHDHQTRLTYQRNRRDNNHRPDLPTMRLKHLPTLPSLRSETPHPRTRDYVTRRNPQGRVQSRPRHPPPLQALHPPRGSARSSSTRSAHRPHTPKPLEIHRNFGSARRGDDVRIGGTALAGTAGPPSISVSMSSETPASCRPGGNTGRRGQSPERSERAGCRGRHRLGIRNVAGQRRAISKRSRLDGRRASSLVSVWKASRIESGSPCCR
jgi:hypothetical protein